MFKRIPLQVPTEALTVWMIGMAVPVLWILAITLEPAPSWSFSPTMWARCATGFAINYGAAQIIWFGIARSLPPVASALSIMFIPVIGLGSAMWITGEQTVRPGPSRGDPDHRRTGGDLASSGQGEGRMSEATESSRGFMWRGGMALCALHKI